MKKKLLIALSALLVIVLALGGYVLYELKFKTYDTADPVVDKLVEETFELELPDGTIVHIDKDGNIVEDLKSENATASESTSGETTKSKTEVAAQANGDKPTVDGANSNKADKQDTTKNGDKPKADALAQKDAANVTVADIKSRYAPTFTMLENQARSRLNGLVGQAASEYSSKKAAGESVSYGYFYNKYMGAASSVEGSTDAAVNTVVKMVENDLQKHGFDKSYAQSFKDSYNATKESLRSEMMNKVLNYR